jgi:nitrite reductase/ring-hydroxylating ferredoxin subunit
VSEPAAIARGTRLCATGDIEDGGARVIEVAPGPPVVEVIVIRRGERFIAYHNHCPHMQAPLNMLASVFVAGDTLICDHHSARFGIDDGLCTAGPCKGDSLIGVPVVVDAGALVVA